jgi:ribonuclease BN (tRNA processing enzyme)
VSSITRRGFIRAAALAALLPFRSLAQAARTRLVLLGTGGGPRVTAKGRARPATLIVANGVPYVTDCGDGVALQLARAGVALDTLRYVFITHHHSDHNLDYGNLIYAAWAAGCASRSTPTARRRSRR